MAILLLSYRYIIYPLMNFVVCCDKHYNHYYTSKPKGTIKPAYNKNNNNNVIIKNNNIVIYSSSININTVSYIMIIHVVLNSCGFSKKMTLG